MDEPLLCFGLGILCFDRTFEKEKIIIIIIIMNNNIINTLLMKLFGLRLKKGPKS